MVDSRLEREGAKQLLRDIETEQASLRKHRFGRAGARLENLDLVMNGEALDIEQMAEVFGVRREIERNARSRILVAGGRGAASISGALETCPFGLVPPDRVRLERKEFGHPSEQVFANLLDFYRIAWDYEPRSFPLQWDKDGKVLEAFTPDFICRSPICTSN